MGQERRGTSMDQLGNFVAALACLVFTLALLVSLVWDIPYETPGLPSVGDIMARVGAGSWIMVVIMVLGTIYFWWMSTRGESS